MLPSFTNSFVPIEGYIFFSFISLFAIILYFSRIQDDISFTKKNTINVISTPFYISFIVSILSVIMLFQPFIEIPIIGGVSILEMASRIDGDLIYIIPLILLHIFLVIFSGIIAFKKISFKGAKSENLDLMFAILVLMIDLLVFAEINGRIHPDIESDNFLVSSISETFRIGIGMYLLLFLSIIQLILALFSNKFSSKAIINPKQNTEVSYISELRDLKKLLDEGVITQGEFETQKSKLI